MKKITILLVLLTSTVSGAQAQVKTESSAHLTFKGVPIDGFLRDYVLKMEKSGLVPVRTDDGIAILTGEFASYKDCTIEVATLKQKDLVSKITVVFPEQATWPTLSENYFSLKELLTEKYGIPRDFTEKFDGLETDDNVRMTQVKSDNCKYYTKYKTEKGNIHLSIEHKGTSCFVKLEYYDKINSDKAKAKAMDDL